MVPLPLETAAANINGRRGRRAECDRQVDNGGRGPQSLGSRYQGGNVGKTMS